jgi:large subunit ribosomal protein L29
MMTKVIDLRQKSQADLHQELLSLLKEQFSLRMQHATRQLSKVSELRRVRRDIARIRTIIAEAKQVK